MIELSVTQGSPEWISSRRNKFNASEAPAMMGVSKNTTRTELLRLKTTGTDREFSDWFQKNILDKGHEIERMTRPLAEKIIGEELYPVVGASEDYPDMQASFDGIVMLGNVIWECKQWSEAKAECVRSGNVPEEDRWQVVEQLVVSGADRCLYTVSKDGTDENTVYCWATLDQSDKDALIAGWKQFALDMESFVPEPAVAKVVAEKVEGMPALFVQVEGRVVASNMDAFKSAAESFINRLPKADQLQTDQDFANADQAAKDCKDAEDKLQVVKAQAQSQAVSIDEAFRAIDHISERIRAARLALEKVVKAEKENRKAEIVTTANRELSAHIAALQGRIGIQVNVAGNFADSIKGLKSLDSMRDKVSVALANAKIEANAIADRIEANRKTVDDMSLFPDFAQVCTKTADDFAALLSMRVAQRKAAEERRLEAEQNRLAAEEIRRIEAESKAKEAEAALMDSTETTPAGTPLTVVHDSSNDGPTMNLGQINAALCFTVSADFLTSLGIQPVRQEKSAKLYDANRFPIICRLISDHVMRQALKKAS